jgi:hypothetical protein
MAVSSPAASHLHPRLVKVNDGSQRPRSLTVRLNRSIQ